MEILYILLAVLGLGILVGIPYVKGAKVQNTAYAGSDGKYAYVVNNKDKFRVNNEGTSLDKKNKIFLVKYKRIGL